MSNIENFFKIISNKIIKNDKEVTNTSGKQVFPKIDSVASTIVKLQNLEALVRSLPKQCSEQDKKKYIVDKITF